MYKRQLTLPVSYTHPPTPVSYTHLDVYKRQVLDIQGHVRFFKFNSAVRIPFFGYRDESGDGLEELQPPAAINNLSQSQQTTFHDEIRAQNTIDAQIRSEKKLPHPRKIIYFNFKGHHF